MSIILYTGVYAQKDTVNIDPYETSTIIINNKIDTTLYSVYNLMYGSPMFMQTKAQWIIINNMLVYLVLTDTTLTSITIKQLYPIINILEKQINNN